MGVSKHPFRPGGARRYATVDQPTAKVLAFPQETSDDVLTTILREGARKMLATAIEAEAQAYVAGRAHLTDADGHRAVTRNGYLPARTIQTPLGAVAVTQPRVRDRRTGPRRETFRSLILPPYLRKTKALEDLLPWLYLKGVSTGDFSEALAALLGADAPGLSASTVTRLKGVWEQEFAAWQQRALTASRYVYLWADGIYFNVRLEDTANARQCILVLMGATADGKKELIAVQDGYRESEQSWRELLLDAQARGLTVDPALATGDGALGFWAAVAKVFPTTGAQRCWVHKTANVLNKLPKSIHAKATQMLHAIWMAETRAAAHRAFDLFVETFGAKYDGAVACLAKDRQELLAFYDFPAEHWRHLRTTNPIESTFASVRLRTDKTKGAGSRMACLTMVFKLALSAQQRWRVLNGASLLGDVIKGETFEDGVKKQAA